MNSNQVIREYSGRRIKESRECKDACVAKMRDWDRERVKFARLVCKYGIFAGVWRVLVVEDILTTGGSVKKVIEATRAIGGEVVGLGVLCNRGGITSHDVGDVPKLFALVNVTLESWTEAECPLCAKGIPINTDVGKGRDFLARKATK